MPVLPALQNPAAASAGGPLTDLMDEMAPEDLQELLEMAQDWSDAGEPANPIGEDPDATAEPDDDTPADEPMPGDNPVQHPESTETLEDEAAESPDQQATEAEDGTENFEGLLGQVTSEASKADAYDQKFDDLIAQAKEAEDAGGDPDAVAELQEEAGDYIDDIAKLVKEAEKAAKDEDADGIAQAGLHIQEKCQIIDTLLQQAQVHAKSNQPAPPAAGAIPDNTPALSLWAKRYGQKAG